MTEIVLELLIYGIIYFTSLNRAFIKKNNSLKLYLYLVHLCHKKINYKKINQSKDKSNGLRHYIFHL